jgi:hypothetical protein
MLLFLQLLPQVAAAVLLLGQDLVIEGSGPAFATESAALLYWSVTGVLRDWPPYPTRQQDPAAMSPD